MTELSIPEKQFLRAFADAIGAMNDSGFEMTPTTLQTFLLVAEDEGKVPRNMRTVPAAIHW